MMNEYKKELGWSVGRFVYQRGSSAPLHFMELQDFHVDSAQGMVETIVLRAIRTRLQSDLPAGKFFEDTKDTSWNHIAARIAATVCSVRQRINSSPTAIVRPSGTMDTPLIEARPA